MKSLAPVMQQRQNVLGGILKSHEDSNQSLNVPYSGRKIKTTLKSEMALTCLWGCMAHGSVQYSIGKEGDLAI
jgi:hypothetical protein